jgi:hypothetical protein
MQMTATIQQWLEHVAVATTRWCLLNVLGPMGDSLSSQATSSAGLQIKSGTSPLAKTGTSAVTTLVANGVPVVIATETDMPALTGLDITAGSYRIFCFFIDQSSVLSVLAGVEGTTRALATFPAFPQGKALVGYLTITYASTFVGGTTPLDTATTNYSSPTGAFNPSVLVGATNF